MVMPKQSIYHYKDTLSPSARSVRAASADQIWPIAMHTASDDVAARVSAA
jgi:hypothetical protein